MDSNIWVGILVKVMSSVVAVDAASKGSGNQRCLIGVAIVIDDIREYRDHYRGEISEWYDEYGLDRENEVIKSDHLSRNIPSYRISEARTAIQDKVLDSSAIDRVNISVCWYEREIDTPIGFKQGGEFINRFVKPYFPVVTLWRYHRKQRRYDPAEKAILDSFSGKITKSWKYAGNEFDLNVIPKGDLTYPEISAADIVASGLSGILPDDKPYDAYERISEGWVGEKLPDTGEHYVEVDLISHESDGQKIDHIKPHKYDIRPHLHYPHPAIFIEESVLSGKEREAIDRSQLMGYLCNVAREMEGCVTKVEIENFPFTVRTGDYIVYNPVNSDKAKTLQNLHPSKDITLVDATDVANAF